MEVALVVDQEVLMLLLLRQVAEPIQVKMPQVMEAVVQALGLGQLQRVKSEVTALKESASLRSIDHETCSFN